MASLLRLTWGWNQVNMGLFLKVISDTIKGNQLELRHVKCVDLQIDGFRDKLMKNPEKPCQAFLLDF